ncbi:DUF5343 domain-containing protein [Sinorhizobium sp. B11]|uniref:DUF5343 domain-containing protein n=1 Tax=Rhizobium bangladeshense TaxID=1138189 RepID=UPI001C83B157|nr:DUF5343 domain-containing protein [Rhizobium bangladeshense]MBX4900123.1 DUF5343 domain-containing protein [Rhizobium bangladeshense]MBX4912324.1 DUF5343 domain-containing protein [Rhizobium bangladeshense]
MGDFAYTNVPGKIKPLLDKIRTIGIPPKVGTPWLKTIGYTSSNDKSLVGVLKFVGLIDSSGTPTPIWNGLRGSHHKKVLGEAIMKGYAELYAIYPDAHTRTNTEIGHVFTTSSTAGQQVISKTVATFKALVAEADFSADAASADTAIHTGPLHTAPVQSAPTSPTMPNMQNGPAVHIDIQIHISPESTAEQIDKIFESMAKHLYGRKDD